MQNDSNIIRCYYNNNGYGYAYTYNATVNWYIGLFIDIKSNKKIYEYYII